MEELRSLRRRETAIITELKEVIQETIAQRGREDENNKACDENEYGTNLAVNANGLR